MARKNWIKKMQDKGTQNSLEYSYLKIKYHLDKLLLMGLSEHHLREKVEEAIKEALETQKNEIIEEKKQTLAKKITDGTLLKAFISAIKYCFHSIEAADEQSSLVIFGVVRYSNQKKSAYAQYRDYIVSNLFDILPFNFQNNKWSIVINLTTNEFENLRRLLQSQEESNVKLASQLLYPVIDKIIEETPNP